MKIFCAKHRHKMLLIAYIVAISVILTGVFYVLVAAGQGHPKLDELNDFIRPEEDQLLQKEIGTTGSYIFVSGLGFLTLIRNFQSATGKWYRGMVREKLFEMYNKDDYKNETELTNKLKRHERKLYWVTLTTFFLCFIFVYFTSSAFLNNQGEGRCYYMPNYKSAAILMGSFAFYGLVILAEHVLFSQWRWGGDLTHLSDPVSETSEHASTEDEKREEPSRGMRSDVLVLDEAPGLSEIQPPSEDSPPPVLTSLLSQANPPLPALKPILAQENTTESRSPGIAGRAINVIKHPVETVKRLYDKMDVPAGEENKCWSRCFA